MRVSLNWLKRYVDLDLTPREVGEKLTMAGFPVPSIEAVGADFALEVEVTSNRPDLLSHMGVARELAGLVGSELHLPVPKLPRVTSDRIDVEVRAPDLCPRYTARIVRGVKVAPTPAWLVDLLVAAGQRSVNNVVDVTNFVMLACGQPLHAFDLAKLRGPKLIVRRAPGESMTAIDGSKIVIGQDEPAICDAVGPVALAGVMGGLETEVSAATRDIVLECAGFDPLAIRAASRAHQIRSDAAFRFERFVDPASGQIALDGACALLAELCGPVSIGTDVTMREEKSHGAREPVGLRTARVGRILGLRIEEAEIRQILNSLGFGEVAGEPKGTTRWTVPTWRPDVSAEIDLVEEVGRRAGFQRVPDAVRIPVRPAVRDPRRRALRRLRDGLVAAGLRECCTAPFVGEGAHDIALFSDAAALRVENPMRSEESLLRRSLLGPLLVVARGNRDRGVSRVRLFEMAPVYLRGRGPGEDTELLLASGVVSGDYFDAKGCVESLLDALRVEGQFSKGAPPPLRADRSATVRIGGEVAGFVGELSARGLEKFGLDTPTALFELRADLLARIASLDGTYRPVPRHPAIERDLAWVVDEKVEWSILEEAVRRGAGELLASVRPFDVFRGAQIGAGKKSVALRMELQAGDRTLTGAEADACVTAVLSELARASGGHLRS